MSYKLQKKTVTSYQLRVIRKKQLQVTSYKITSPEASGQDNSCNLSADRQVRFNSCNS